MEFLLRFSRASTTLEESGSAERMRVLRYRLLMKVFATVTRNVISAIVYTERRAYKFPFLRRRHWWACIDRQLHLEHPRNLRG